MRPFDAHRDVVADVSLKLGGSCRLWPDEALNQKAFKNRAGFFRSLEILPENTVGALLAHSNRVMTIEGRDRGRTFSDVDGFVTAEPNVFLTVTVADCLPIFLYDPARHAVGLLHAGWRGLDNGIIANGVRKMQSLGSDPANVLVTIGPGIGPCHFEVGEELLENFKDYPGAAEKRGGALFLDLRSIAAAQLAGVGIPPENIEVSGECTACLPKKYFSYRRDKPLIMEAMVAVIGLRSARR